MQVFSTQGFPVFEPRDEADLSSWRPSREVQFQFVHVSPREYWVFGRGEFLGSIQRLNEGFQATSSEQGAIIAPLATLLMCAYWLENRHTQLAS